MAEIGVLEGYKHKEDVPDSEYLRLENQLSFPLYVVAKEIVNASWWPGVSRMLMQ